MTKTSERIERPKSGRQRRLSATVKREPVEAALAHRVRASAQTRAALREFVESVVALAAADGTGQADGLDADQEVVVAASEVDSSRCALLCDSWVCLSSINREHRAGCEARTGAGEIKRSCHDLLRIAGASHGVVLARSAGEFFRARPSLADISMKRPRHDAIHAN